MEFFSPVIIIIIMFATYKAKRKQGYLNKYKLHH